MRIKQVKRVVVPLSDAEALALFHMAREEFRDEPLQMRRLLVEEARRRGLLPKEKGGRKSGD